MSEFAATSAAIVQENHPEIWNGALAELSEGLLAPQASIAPKYFYDELGSCLFTAITRLPEYYLTRTEANILADNAGAIRRMAGPVHTLLDLGAGDCAKAESLFDTLRPDQYVPIDISADYLRAAAQRLDLAYPDLAVKPVAMDFSQSMDLPADIDEDGRLFFYPGSSIGNWDPEQALAMLSRIHDCSLGRGCGLLIGVDRVKSPDVLLAAYDDPLQVTAAFNRNVLLQLNRLLGTDFRLDEWDHFACYNEAASCIEMHLRARVGMMVSWPGANRYFSPGDTLLTECSYKYQPADFAELLAAAGYGEISHWTDADGWFSVFHARA